MNSVSTLLHASALSWSLGGTSLLDNIGLSLSPGEILGIIGPNGAGKSSLIRILANLQQPDSGERRLLDTDYRDWEPQAFARALAYLEQDAQIHWSLTTQRVVGLGRLPWRRPFQAESESDQQAIAQALAACGIEALSSRPVNTLSAGERALTSLARIVAGKPNLIIADEPAAALDPYHQLMLMEILQGLASGPEQTATIVVMHDLNMASRFCHRLLLLHRGCVVASGTPEEVLTAATLKHYYRIETAIIPGDKGPHITAMKRL